MPGRFAGLASGTGRLQETLGQQTDTDLSLSTICTEPARCDQAPGQQSGAYDAERAFEPVRACCHQAVVLNR